MTDPLISVIIPVYNNEKTLGVALESILRQTYSNIEVIIVDDFSTDASRTVAEAYEKTDARVRIIEGYDDKHRFDAKLNRNINAGWSARNAGLSVAKGEYITFQDGDDASLLNRIEIQYGLLKKYKAKHVTIDWCRFDEALLNKQLAVDDYEQRYGAPMYGPQELYELSQKTKGRIEKMLPRVSRRIPFHIKRYRVLHRFFFGSLAPYPGTGNSPLFTRSVAEKVRFRPLSERIWPSFMGRGADRDFNFQVAETFRNSYVFSIPLYMWRVKNENERHSQELLLKTTN